MSRKTACVFDADDTVIESSMDDIEIEINGDTTVESKGVLNDREISKIRSFIKMNYKEMYMTWLTYSDKGFYGE